MPWPRRRHRRSDDADRVRRLIAESQALVGEGRARAALQRADQAVQGARELPDDLRAAALDARALAHDAADDVEAAETDLQRAESLDASSASRWLLHSQLAGRRGDWERARAFLDEALRLAGTAGETWLLARVLWERANVALMRGDVVAARTDLAAAVDAATREDDLEALAYAQMNLAELDLAEGHADRAAEGFRRVRAVAGRLPGARALPIEAEPAPPGQEPAGPVDLPAPSDDDPVLRIVPAAGRAMVELWPGGGAAATRCEVPFDYAVHPQLAERLRWYVEDYAGRPLDPAPAIAAGVEADLEVLGERLFAALLGAPAAAGPAAALRAQVERTRIEIVVTAPWVDALPWELLRDPETGADLALTARSITRTTGAAAPSRPRADRPVRALLVTSRPEGRLDVPFRSVADALLREVGDAIDVDALRPPTFDRLREVLVAAHAEGRPFDLVHFDGHGDFDPDQGGVLVFGDDALISGDEIGAVMRAGDVPALVLNACRSAAGEATLAYESVARGALGCGLGAVVAMRFNVYVPTAATFVGGLYRALADGEELGEAVTRARRLLTDEARRGGLPLVRDWCVPAIYQSAPMHFTGTAHRPTRPLVAGLPPAPAHGFVGRDELFVELESVLSGSPHALLTGFAGAGKTTVAVEFARWYAATGGTAHAGPYLDLADAPLAATVRARIGPAIDRRPFMVWDNVRTVDAGLPALLDEVAARGGRVLLISERVREIAGLPALRMPNFPLEDALALTRAVIGPGSSPEDAVTLAEGLDGHAAALVTAARALPGRDAAAVLDGMRRPSTPPADWALPVAAGLDVATLARTADQVARFTSYVTVPGYGTLIDDLDRAEGALAELASQGVLKLVYDPGVYAIHPGLRVALADAGRYEPPDEPFVRAVADMAVTWSDLAESMGVGGPWHAEVRTVVQARRQASAAGWWALVVRLLTGLRGFGLHGGLTELWRRELLAAAPDFVDPETGEACPGMEAHRGFFLGQLASLAGIEGDRQRALRFAHADLELRRAEASPALEVPADQRSDEDNALVRRLAVGLNNFAHARVGDHEARTLFEESAALARTLGDWRLEALNRLNLGAYWMTTEIDYDRAEAELEAGDALVEDDEELASRILGERATLQYERGLAATDPEAAQHAFTRAAELMEIVYDMRGSEDAVLAHQLGQVHRQLGWYESSRAWFERAIALREAGPEPGAGADARLHLAEMLEEAGLADEALQFALSAEHKWEQATSRDEDLRVRIERAVARLTLITRA